MKNRKVNDISYWDLKEACKIFNQHEQILGTRIKMSRTGFNDLRESFIKAVRAVPTDRQDDIPEEVMAFYKALPGVCLESANVAVPKPVKKGVGADKDIPELGQTSKGTQDAFVAGARTKLLPLTQREEIMLKQLPPRGGKVKVKATCTVLDAIRHLEDLVVGLKYGQIFIASRNQKIMMKPDGLLSMKLAAGIHKEGKSYEERLTVEFKWLRSVVMDCNDVDYSISSRRHANR